MRSKQPGADLNFACPLAEIAEMWAKVRSTFSIAMKLRPPRRLAGMWMRCEPGSPANTPTTSGSPLLAAERGEIYGVIELAATRSVIVNGLRALCSKAACTPEGKHGNIQL